MRKHFKILGWTLLGVLAVPIGLYLIALVVNRHDQPPSAATIHLREVLDQRAPVADDHNGYIYVLGFSAPEGSDPHAAGLQQRAWLEEGGYLPDSGKEDPLSSPINYRAARSPEVEGIVQACVSPARRCAELLEKSSTLVADWLSAQTLLLERYRTLLTREGWLEQVPHNMHMPIPLYSAVTDGQRLLFADAWQRAGAGDVAAVRDALQSDIAFWRRVLASSDLAITKMIAVFAIRQHFAFGNIVLRRLPAKQALQAIPASWTSALSDEERSMLRPMAGELRYLEGVLSTLTDAPIHGGVLYSDHFMSRVYDRFQASLFQPQDTINQSADQYLSLAQQFAVPLDRYPEQLEQLNEPPRRSFKRLYNVTGNALVSGGIMHAANHAVRVGDIEGMRRAALATNELRARSVAEADVTEALRSASLRNPYTDEPFQWDEDERAVVFVGLESGARGRHAYIY